MDQSTEINHLATELLSRLDLPFAIDIHVTFDPKNHSYQVDLHTSDPALLIGYHGETLSALQTILNQHLYSATQIWLNITLNVNDYRQHRQTTIIGLADSAISQVLTTSRPYSLPPMTPSERRLVHLHLADHPQISTSSIGTGRSRSVVISLKE